MLDAIHVTVRGNLPSDELMAFTKIEARDLLSEYGGIGRIDVTIDETGWRPDRPSGWHMCIMLDMHDCRLVSRQDIPSGSGPEEAEMAVMSAFTTVEDLLRFYLARGARPQDGRIPLHTM